jgi:hypothetical protein
MADLNRTVIPAQAGIHGRQARTSLFCARDQVDPGFRRDDSREG